jgi:hypothetical protein
VKSVGVQNKHADENEMVWVREGKNKKNLERVESF